MNRNCLVVCLALLACTHVARVPEKETAEEPLHPIFKRGLWVRAVSIASPDSIQKIIQVAQKTGTTDLYVQVVVAGYAYYNSKILPRSQYLVEVSGSDYDPLSTLLKAAKRKNIRVHAWVNALLVWSLQAPPDSARHILYTHPEWFILDADGKSMAHYSYQEWLDAGLEGLYLDPARPEVQDYLQSICEEIVKTYNVAGIHLDFIRYPGTLWGLTQDIATIIGAYENNTVSWLNCIRYPQLPFQSRWVTWKLWQANLQKEKNITTIIEKMHSSLQTQAVNPACQLTAAVFADPGMARYRFAQNWANWDTLLDYPLVMSYTTDISLFSGILHYTLAIRPDAVFGIGFLWPGIERQAYEMVTLVQKSQSAGISFFDFTSLDTMVDFEAAHAVQDTGLLSKDTLVDTIAQVFADTLPFFPFDTSYETSEQARLFAEYLLSLSLNKEYDLARLRLSREEFSRRVHDDVFTFAVLDSLLALADSVCIEPPHRDIDFEFLAWQEDSGKVRQAAQNTKRLTLHRTIYPRALDRLSQSVFNAELDTRQQVATRAGIYVFKVTRAYEGGKSVLCNDIEPELLPTYRSWTVKENIQRIMKDYARK